MEFTYISFDIVDSVAFIKFNRPESLNSFNKKMAYEIQEALKEAKDNDEIRSILITGEGRAFSSGQDLNEALGNGEEAVDLGKIVRQQYNPIIMAIRTIEKPVVAAVNGVAAGAGANIALACDIVIASNEASFIQSFSKIGLIPDSGGTYFIPRLVGMAQATALMMLGDKVTGTQAESIGLIYKSYPASEFMAEALAVAKRLADMPTKGLGLTKRALNQSFQNILEFQLKIEEDAQREAGNTKDYKEGVQAFIEKRKPSFQGK